MLSIHISESGFENSNIVSTAAAKMSSGPLGHVLARCNYIPKALDTTWETGGMLPKALKQVNLPRLKNTLQGSCSELIAYRHGATEKQGKGLRTLKCRHRLCGKSLLWFQLPRSFLEMNSVPGTNLGSSGNQS